MIRFRSGAFVPGRPVLPVALKYVVPNGMSCGWVLTQQAVAAPLWRRVPKDLTHLLRILAARGKCIEARHRMYVACCFCLAPPAERDQSLLPS